MKVFFIDLDENNVDAIKEDNVNAKLPYERINITKDADFVAIQNDMVGSCPLKSTARSQNRCRNFA